ncbi:MAG: UDP-N-acetylmuramoyl-L-alanine--D-glutamate ligase, partial [Myxococcota bacterium]
KSTTTALIGALVRAAGKKAFVGGNFGDPLVAWLARGEPAEVAVLELSSFQLETAYRFSANVALVLNVTPDHFDRYPDIESYALTKQRLIENLGPGSVAVLNHDDVRVAAMAEHCAGRVWWFGTAVSDLEGLGVDGATLDGDTLVPHGALESLGRVDLSHPRLIGKHNRQNALAAWIAAAALGVATEATRDAIHTGYLAFQGLEHRLELVADVGGVRFINDSKATNDDAAAVALRAMDRPVILLAGGRGKGAGYASLVSAAQNCARVVVAFGEDRHAVARAFTGRTDVVTVGSMREAFDTAVARAVDGDAVLLAPACASFDEFANYGERGRAFKRWVNDLQGKVA